MKTKLTHGGCPAHHLVYRWFYHWCICGLADEKDETNLRQRSEEELELAFSQPSRQALSENQGQFSELARNEFRKLQDDLGQQLNHKK